MTAQEAYRRAYSALRYESAFDLFLLDSGYAANHRHFDCGRNCQGELLSLPNSAVGAAYKTLYAPEPNYCQHPGRFLAIMRDKAHRKKRFVGRLVGEQRHSGGAPHVR